MAGRIEKTYGRLFRYTTTALNPFKKIIIETTAIIHKHINIQALEILKNDNYLDAYSFFSDYITQINEGAVWADLDFKSAGHFYNPVKERGLYGNRNALSLAVEYYGKAIYYWKMRDIDEAMFFLGAAVHLVQDVTIPQHANIRLLNSHRKYENFIRRTYLSTPEFNANKGGYYMDTIDEVVRCNARTAIKIYNRLKDIKDDEKRHYTITKLSLIHI